MTDQERQAETPRPPRQAAPERVPAEPVPAETASDRVADVTVDLRAAAASVTASDATSGAVGSTSGADTTPAPGPPPAASAGGTGARSDPDRAGADDPDRDPETEAAGADSDPGTEAGGADPPGGGARGWLNRSRRLTGAGAMIAVLLAGLGFTLVIQVRNVSEDPTLSAARQEDLVRILSDLQAREQRLNGDIADLEESQRELANGVRGNQAALEEARERADELGILAGTLPAAGPGLHVHFRGNVDQIKARLVLDAVQELRGAGAEAMQITGGADDTNPVRIVASTYFLDSRDGIDVGGILLTAPYTISVIGDPETMRTALNIPGGVVEAVAQSGGTVTMDELDAVTVAARHGEISLEYARPVP